MKDKSYLTAIKRNQVSLPMRWLSAAGLLSSDALDFGCGRGFDADHFNMSKYDPHYFPVFPQKVWDCIVCNYVLNVVPINTGSEILAKIATLLSSKGVAYITVRRDVKTEGLTMKGTLQHNAILDLPIVYEKKNQFCIYKLVK